MNLSRKLENDINNKAASEYQSIKQLVGYLDFHHMFESQGIVNDEK